MPTFPSLSFTAGAGRTLQLRVHRPEGDATAVPLTAEAHEPPKGALFDKLLAMSANDLSQLLQSVVRQLGGLMTQSPSIHGNEIRARIDDGFFLSAEEAATAACAALGVDFDPARADPRIAKDPMVVEVGNCRIRFVPPDRRTPSLLSIARQAAAGEKVDADPVATGEADLRSTAGQMAIRGRGLPVHARDFGEGFVERLEAGNDRKQLLVTGAGTSRFAYDLFFGCERPLQIDTMSRIDALVRRPNEDKHKIVAVDLADPPSDTKHPNFRAETGLYAEMSSERLLGGGPLFTDVVDMMGALTYSPTLSKDLQKSLDVLEEGGMLWIGTSDSVAIYEDDRLLLLPEWLSKIDGLEVDCGPRPPSNGTYFQFGVRKTKADVEVPALDLLHRQNGYPRAVSTIQLFRPVTDQ